MNYLLYITIQENQFNQMAQAVSQLNQLEKNPGCAISLSRQFPEKGSTPAMVEIGIRYKDLFVLFHLAKYFGIILEKVNPQTL